MASRWIAAGVLAALLIGAAAPIPIGGSTQASVTWTNSADSDLAGTEIGFFPAGAAEPTVSAPLLGPQVLTAAGAACTASITPLISQLTSGTWTLRLRHWDTATNKGEWSDPVEFIWDSRRPGKPVAIRILIISQ